MRIDQPQFSEDRRRLAFNCCTAQGDFAVWYQSKTVELDFRTEALLTLGLLPAMREGGEFVVPESEVSARFLEGMERAQEIHRSWFDGLSGVDIKGVSPVVRPPRATSARTAASFSGGVDSHYTLAVKHEEIDDLMYLHGFDDGITDPELRRRISAMLEVFGEHYGKRILELETNARELWYASGLRHMGGSPVVFAAVHLLPPAISRYCVPASFCAETMVRHTWNPETLPCWATETLELVEHGGDVSRLDKVKALSRSPLVLKHLHVCWGDHGADYNCGICEKCLRTIVALTICGALEQSCFPGKLDLKRIANMHLTTEHQRGFARQSLRQIENNPEFRGLAQALRQAACRPAWRLRLAELYWAVKKKFGLVS